MNDMIEIPVGDDKKMDAFQELMNQVQDEQVKYTQNLAKEMNISENCALDIVYLRSRSRHTPELEQELIRRHQEGVPVNIMEFPE